MTDMKTPTQVRRKQLAFGLFGVAAVIGLVVVGLYLSDPNRNQKSLAEQAKESGQKLKKSYTANTTAANTAGETWIALSEQRLTAADRKAQDLETRYTEALQRIEKLESEKGSAGRNAPGTALPAPPLTSPAQLPIAPQQPIGSRPLPPPPLTNQQSDLRTMAGQQPQQMSSITVVSFASETATEAKDEKVKNIASYLPTGSFSKAVLLSGLDAPTGGQAASNPVPVLLRLIDDGNLANHFKSEIQDCTAVGAGYGDLSSERANIRLETLTCILVNGDIIEVPLKGYVAGEDGKNGFRGRLVEKQGALIARTLFAGTLAGLGMGVSETYKTVQSTPIGPVETVDPEKNMQYGVGKGVGNALEKVADFYLQRAQEMYPVIEIDAQRIGEIVLTSGTDFGRALVGKIKKDDGE